jgi:hypothetical protein
MILSKIRQALKNKYCRVHLYVIPKIVKFTEEENRMIASGSRMGERGVCVKWV